MLEIKVDQESVGNKLEICVKGTTFVIANEALNVVCALRDSLKQCEGGELAIKLFDAKAIEMILANRQGKEEMESSEDEPAEEADE